MEKISIVIPAYNEENNIKKTLNQVISWLERKSYKYEITVVDDGSIDTTPEIVRGVDGVRFLQNERNMGKGYSVRRGILSAEGKYILFVDADSSFPPPELGKFLDALRQEWDIAIGSKYLPESKRASSIPWYRNIGGYIFNLLARLLLIQGIKDTQCGLKGFKGEVAKTLFGRQRINGFAFDAEVLYLAQKMGYRIKELPIQWRCSFKKRDYCFLIKGFSMVLDLFRIKFMKYDV